MAKKGKYAIKVYADANCVCLESATRKEHATISLCDYVCSTLIRTLCIANERVLALTPIAPLFEWTITNTSVKVFSLKWKSLQSKCSRFWLHKICLYFSIYYMQQVTTATHDTQQNASSLSLSRSQCTEYRILWAPKQAARAAYILDSLLFASSRSRSPSTGSCVMFLCTETNLIRSSAT